MVFRYFDHQHKGRSCFISKCDKRPEYTDCCHPAAKTIVDGEVDFVDILHDDCPSCQKKLSEAIRASMAKMGFNLGKEGDDAR